MGSKNVLLKGATLLLSRLTFKYLYYLVDGAPATIYVRVYLSKQNMRRPGRFGKYEISPPMHLVNWAFRGVLPDSMCRYNNMPPKLPNFIFMCGNRSSTRHTHVSAPITERITVMGTMACAAPLERSDRPWAASYG